MNGIWIVITSINPPTAAVREFAALVRSRGGGVVVVGDTKSPAEYRQEGVTFLSIADQRRLFPGVADLIPTRSYARKNLGYLFAMREGARVIIDTDDDNRPLSGFGERLECEVLGAELGGAEWVNVYSHFSDRLIWPRGLPLNRVHENGTKSAVTATRRCPVQQFLADADPDVDAIYRLLHPDPVHFRRDVEPVVIAAETFVPFNSQNTAFFPEAFGLLYLPSFVSFRMTDIWRSFVAQRVLWETGSHVAFHGPTVYQERNAHDLMHDFADEVVGYLHNEAIGRKLASMRLDGLPVPEAAAACYAGLRDMKIVEDREFDVLRAWNDARAQVTR